MSPDKIDFKILRILQENGRITNLELSGLVGLSPAPTLERVKKLEQSGFIKSYHATLDEKKLGLAIQAIVHINLTRQIENAIAKFKEQIAVIPEVTECFQVTGNSDFVLMVMVKDIPAFEELISHKLGRIEEIGQMQTMVVLSKVKEKVQIPFDKH